MKQDKMNLFTFSNKQFSLLSHLKARNADVLTPIPIMA